ncbi:hypothetical protein NDU88_000511 [Pleurodeles waltl]|uniref:Uncharacterized protein n=1 Tax=Pleurodeles waltl TaxID=8319 RepID=A0AAV7U3X9_PLEWA|nr:hypothetical protein NDU88_000511 [Pleurodeles waltl]
MSRINQSKSPPAAPSPPAGLRVCARARGCCPRRCRNEAPPVQGSGRPPSLCFKHASLSAHIRARQGRGGNGGGPARRRPPRGLTGGLTVDAVCAPARELVARAERGKGRTGQSDDALAPEARAARKGSAGPGVETAQPLPSVSAGRYTGGRVAVRGGH